MQVLEEQSQKFLQEMNSQAIASILRGLGLIPESVKNGIKRSTCRDDANECLLTYLKEDATKEQVRGVLKCASEKTDYGRMSEFAAKLLQKLPQGLCRYMFTCRKLPWQHVVYGCLFYIT